MRIEVTQEHIDKGNPGDCALCPVALAILDAVEGAVRAEVGDACVGYRKLGEDWLFVETPDEVVAFFTAFDEHKQVSPFAFELDFNHSHVGQDDDE